MEASKNVIQEGVYVIVKKENAMRLFQVQKERQIYFDKRKLCLDGVIGSPFGSTFEVKNKSLERVNRKPESSCCSDEQECAGCDGESKDNRFLNDDGKSQKLSKEDIEALKDNGLTGKEIIRHLIENSTTFKDKSDYSKEKYLKKKEKKYLNRVTVLRVTTRLLTEMYYSQNPLKTLNMRMDSLAQIMTSSNVRSGGKYVIVENCMGLVVGAVLERLDGRGKLVQVHSGDVSSRQTVDAYNFTDRQRECLVGLQWRDLKVDPDAQIPADESDERTEEKEESKRWNDSPEKLQRRRQRDRERANALKTLETRDADGLIVASKFHPSEIVLRLLPFLALSRPFAIFCPYKEPMIDCYAKLKASGTCLMLRLSETWCRTLQVLPNRTHPVNNTSGTGGYILTGVTAQPHPNDAITA